MLPLKTIGVFKIPITFHYYLAESSQIGQLKSFQSVIKLDVYYIFYFFPFCQNRKGHIDAQLQPWKISTRNSKP